ncbi:PREDICTED: vam6/Vps39-like protein isoform X2 [Nelumbo nucifera]|uniref:Vam6/Vps39-like protein isoform X2 n=1 Tax=Nelumbo nucifera TaxID=4432 RepID=A0A1U8AA65_NELNU|nr:PREDICTED: vam6/Vps39-like protein isoform X2 [Nelumbo nucifera]
MVHNAFDSFQLLRNCPAKIECAASYGSKLLLSCTDGSIRIYAPESSTSSDGHSSPPDRGKAGILREPYVLEKAVMGFWKKHAISMEVSVSRNILISLSDSIAIHRIPNLEAVMVIPKSKGATVFAWDDRRGYLCFGKQKRVGIFRQEAARDFVELHEFGVPDSVKSISWCGENICLGIRRAYMILNTTNGMVSEVFPSGRIQAPLVVLLPSGELVLGKDNIGVFVDQNGKLLQEGKICWSEAPTSMVIHIPYAIAQLPRHIEIRSVGAPHPLVQIISLHDVRFLIRSNNGILVVLDSSIYGLLPVPLGAQIIQLTASGNFEEALALCKSLPPEDSTLRAAKEGSIHIRYGHYLFDNGNYEEAMEQFLASSVDVTYVLALYPYMALPKTLSIPDTDKVVYFASDTLDHCRISSNVSDIMESSSPSHLCESNEKEVLESKKMSHDALIALVKLLQKKRFCIIERATAEGTDEAVSDAVDDSIKSCKSSRLKNSGKSHGHIHISSGARDMAAALDTALLQALLLTGQSSVALDLLKGPNYCDVKICEEFLQKRNYNSELLELYKGNNLHREALKFLNQLVEELSLCQPQSGPTQTFTPEMIIKYLKPLCATDPMLVLEYSTFVLQSCPAQTIELFLSGNLSADLVNSYLKQNAPRMQATYLELMLSMNENRISTNLQNELVLIYLAEVLDWHAEITIEHMWDEKAYSPIRKKLLSALEGISGYNPEVVLKRLPADALYEERAILLGKMNQHQLALALYVHKLQCPELALAYCDRVYDVGQHQPSKPCVSAQSTGSQKVGSAKAKVGRGAKKIAEIEGAEDLRFSPSGTDSGRSDGEGDEPSQEGAFIMLEEALDLLGRRWDRVNGGQALKLLPREIKLQDLAPFLEPLLKKSSESHRNFSVINSLRHSQNLQVKEELYKQRRTFIMISSDSMCSLCNKRIGTSVFAVYPNGKALVHFVCFRDSQIIKAVRSSPIQKCG